MEIFVITIKFCICLTYASSFSESAADGNSRVKYKLMDLPINLPSQKAAMDKPNPKQGIGLCYTLNLQYEHLYPFILQIFFSSFARSIK